MKLFSIIPIFILLYAGCHHSKNTQSENKGSDVVYKDTVVSGFFFNRTKGAIAMDGGYSIPLSNHKDLWVFGDTYVNHYDSATKTIPCLFQVRNSALLQPLGDWNWKQTRTLLSNGPGLRNYLKNSSNSNHFIWPGSGIQLGDTVYVYCNRNKNTKSGMGFGSNGPDAFAKITLPKMKVVGFKLLPSFEKVSFGPRFIENKKDGFVYVYGSYSKKGSLLNNIILARFPIKSPGENWTYWDGKGWSSNIKNIFAIDSIPAFSWDVCKFKNKYLLLYSGFSLACDQGKKIYAAVGNSMTGPFTKPKSIYTIPDRVDGHSPFFYGVAAHPEYVNKNDELLVTYCINGYEPCVTNCVNHRLNPHYYQLRGIRVPYQLIKKLE